MVRPMLLALTLLMPVVAVADPQVYVSLGTDVLPTAIATVAPAIQYADDRVAVLAVQESELEALSEAMHEHHDRCAGFMVHESLAQAMTELVPAAPKPTPAYTLDRAAMVRAILPAIHEPEVREMISALSANKNRYYRSESGAAVSAWLRDRWRGYSTRTDVTVELFDQGYPQKSVILTIPGTTKKDEVVVIGGHLDSIAAGASNSDAPGADDDASGIASVDAIARALLAADYRPERTIQFMAYAAEEVGLRGSQAIVRAYKQKSINVVGVMQLDMTNYAGSNRDIWMIDDFTSKAQNAFIVKLIETYTPYTWGSDRCGYACSDHASWHRAGVPASMPHEARSADRNRAIHTSRDTLATSENHAHHAVKFASVGAAYAIELGKGTFGEPAAITTASRCDGGWKFLALGFAALALLGLARRWP